MQQYTVSQASKLLSIPKDTLRYYDKIGLLRPARGDNRYRVYSGADVVNLQYIEVMKYAGFSLSEIRHILQNRQRGDAGALADTQEHLVQRQREIERKIELLHATHQLLKEAEQRMAQKETPTDAKGMNDRVEALFWELRRAGK